MLDSQRLDTWLWAARFYKTRTHAAKEVSGGKVKLNGARTKPAHAVTPGDQIDINKVSFAFTVIVQSLSSTRGPSTRAKELYEETGESRKLRQQRAKQDLFTRQLIPYIHCRPGKHERRRLLQQKGKIF